MPTMKPDEKLKSALEDAINSANTGVEELSSSGSTDLSDISATMAAAMSDAIIEYIADICVLAKDYEITTLDEGTFEHMHDEQA